MIRSKTWILAGVLGVAALLLGSLLVSLMRDRTDVETEVYRSQFVDTERMFALTRTLSSDALKGRAPGTQGSEAARGFILKRFEALGLEKFDESYEHSFAILPDEQRGVVGGMGVNLIGWIPGRSPQQGLAMIVTAHYDHVGLRDGETYNGADDNASGVGALIAVAEHFTKSPPEHDIVIVALDAEEIGLLGARDFVRNPPVAAERMALNMNFDMVSRSDVNELYAAGPSHSPVLVPLIGGVAAKSPAKLIIGHDTPKADDPIYDWTSQSDHAAFFEAGIPFLYLGVEDHPDYHQPTDDFEAIPLDFFARSADTLVMLAEAADDQLATLFPSN